jgi:hypothetical protein
MESAIVTRGVDDGGGWLWGVGCVSFRICCNLVDGE